jgi:ribosomal protein L31
MEQGIHREYKVTTVRCSSGEFQTRSTGRAEVAVRPDLAGRGRVVVDRQP